MLVNNFSDENLQIAIDAVKDRDYKELRDHLTVLLGEQARRATTLLDTDWRKVVTCPDCGHQFRDGVI